MPALGKLQLSNDDGTTLGFVALTAIDGVAFTVEDGRIRDFRQIGLFPLHGQLEGMLEAELAALPIDGDVDETTAPELVHLIETSPDVCERRGRRFSRYLNARGPRSTHFADDTLSLGSQRATRSFRLKVPTYRSHRRSSTRDAMSLEQSLGPE